MKRAIARKWAQALESGEYKQTTGSLRDSQGFCCLGVLCNLHAQEHSEISADETDPSSYLTADAVLPETVMEWAGMRYEDGRFINKVEVGIQTEEYYGRYASCLIELNDELEYEFKDIAKVIRKHYKEL